MTSQQHRHRNLSSDSRGRERMPSDDGVYQGRLKPMDGRKGTCACQREGSSLVRSLNFSGRIHQMSSSAHVTEEVLKVQLSGQSG